MSPSATHKRVALRLRPFRLLSGFLDSALLGPDGAAAELELLLPGGQLQRVARTELQAAYFLADFSQAAALEAAIPRGAQRLPGVRLRCRTRDHQWLEGLLASDLLALDQGIELSPLYVGCPWQRVHLPAHALEQLTVVEVVSPPRRRRAPATPSSQHSLFDLPERE